MYEPVRSAGRRDSAADPTFATCQPPPSVCALGLRAHRFENVGATAFFRQAERCLDLASADSGLVMVLLLRGAVLAKQAGGHELNDA